MKIYINCFRLAESRFMFSGYLEAQPPTVATWSSLYNLYNFFGILAAIIVISYFVYVMIRYRHRKDKPPVHHHEEKWGNWKKILLTLAITSSVLFIAEYQTFQSESLIIPPRSPDAIHIDVIAQQWSWTFVYPNGARVVGNLTVPEGGTIILNITSLDVAHSFGLADLSVGMDAIPGLTNTAWFEAPQNNVVYTIRCKELCGTGHAFMTAKLTVVDQGSYDSWYASLGAK